MADAQNPVPPKSTGSLFFIILAVVNVLAGGMGLALVYKSTLGYHYQATTEADVKEPTKENDQPVLFVMEPMTVNLGGAPQRMVRLSMSLEMLDQNGFQEVMQLGARARDAIMKILSQKTFSDIESLQGKLFLKDQIALALNTTLKHGVIKDVYFTDFVVQ